MELTVKATDLLRMAWQGLWQRKLATALNLVGISVGACVVLLAIAGLSGVESTFRTIFDASEFAREVDVRPQSIASSSPPGELTKILDEIPESRRESISKLINRAWGYTQRRQRKYFLSEKDLENCRSLPGALRVVPELFDRCEIDETAGWMRKREDLQWLGKRMNIGSTDVAQSATKDLVMVGQLPDESNRRDAVMISEILAYRLGFVTTDELQSLIGKKITVKYGPQGAAKREFLSWIVGGDSLPAQDVQAIASLIRKAKQLEASLTSQERLVLNQLEKWVTPRSEKDEQKLDFGFERTFRIVAVMKFEDRVANVTQLFRRFNMPRDADIMLHYQTMYEMWKEAKLAQNLRSAKLVIDSTHRLEEVEELVRERNCQPNTALWAWDRIKEQIETAGVLVTIIGLTILLTTSLGITNTLIASVVHRTREIGMLKSLGMRDRDLGLMIVLEGFVLGAVGSLIATLLAYVAVWVGQHYVSQYAEMRAGIPIEDNLIQFTPLSFALAYGLTIVLCMLASFYPAFRAARMDPVEAMRYE